MSQQNKGQYTEGMNQIIAQARRDQKQREKGYRAQALKIYPPICGHCGREFEGKRLSELTIHHKDNNHDNNPPDGSNWELLCLYCHDYEHSEYLGSDGHDRQSPESGLTFRPFADLKSLLDDEE